MNLHELVAAADADGFYRLDDIMGYVQRHGSTATRHEVYLACRALDEGKPSLSEAIVSKLKKSL